ncbi:glycoside hydrolase family 43 protein [Stipitochalara longipes BDJ]|nr:glycoside hydrolase family 43 protein [Stipitochalara longipes BDJ]
MLQLLATLLAFTGSLGATNAAAQGTAVFSNTRRFMFDVNGNQIDATAGKISYGKYYLYGNGAGGVNAYSSIDLVNWAHEGALGYGGSRSHIIYNAASKKYIVWADGAGASGYIVGTSTSPVSGYTAAGVAAVDANPTFQKADMAVEVIDSKGYLVYSTLNFQDPRAGSMWPAIYQTSHIVQLTDDYLSTTKMSYNVTSAAFDLVDNQVESPDLFYHVSASNSCGLCSGTISVLFRSKSIQGPWTRQILAGYSCNSQPEGVLPLVDPVTNKTTYLWHGNSVPGNALTPRNGHIFQPLQFNDDGSALPLDCSDNARFEYVSVCDSDSFNLYQTWTNSKSGTLKEIGVNVASTTQTGQLNIKVFKFSNLDDFVAPGYKWTLLNSTVITRAQTATVFNVVSIYLNTAVKQGDMLGISYGNNYPSGQFIAGGDTVPYCHLEYHTNSTTQVLFEQGAGQTSPRGLDGKTSVVVRREGRGIKFYSIVL